MDIQAPSPYRSGDELDEFLAQKEGHVKGQLYVHLSEFHFIDSSLFPAPLVIESALRLDIYDRADWGNTKASAV